MTEVGRARSAPATSGRRGFTVAMALIAAGAGLMLLAMAQTWISAAHVVEGFPRTDVSLTGSSAEPLGQAAALVALAGIVAVVAARGVVRVIVGLLVALAGSMAAVSAGLFLAFRRGMVEAELQAVLDMPDLSVAATEIDEQLVWPYLVIVGGLAVLGGGVLTIVRGSRWPVLGARYDAPTRRSATAGGGAADRSTDDPWAALDRGEDPT